MTSKLASFNSGYSLRPSTLALSEASQSKMQSKGRHILSLSLTPSLVLEDKSKREVDPERSYMKSHLRIQNFWLDAIIESVAKTTFSRGKTHLQGSQAPRGFQSAHFSLAPSTTDSLTKDVIDSIVEKGLTPNRSSAYLRSKIELTSPDRKRLDDHHEDRQFVRNFILKRLPDGVDNSSLYGTRFFILRNATFDNPDESNRFDSKLEWTIQPFLEMLSKARAEGLYDENTATEQLVKWLDDFYRKSIANNTERLADIDTYLGLNQDLIAFEDLYQDETKIPPEELHKYIETAKQFLALRKKLSEKLIGSPGNFQIKRMRWDFYFLNALAKRAQKGEPHAKLEQLFLAHKRHFQSRPKIDQATLVQSYEFFLKEAQAQLEGIQPYIESCTIANLKTLFFGVLVNKERVEPTEKQLHEQIFEVFKIATPYKSKIRKIEDKENAYKNLQQRSRKANQLLV